MNTAPEDVIVHKSYECSVENTRTLFLKHGGRKYCHTVIVQIVLVRKKGGGRVWGGGGCVEGCKTRSGMIQAHFKPDRAEMRV